MVRHVEAGIALAAVDDHANGDWFGTVRSALSERLQVCGLEQVIDNVGLVAG